MDDRTIETKFNRAHERMDVQDAELRKIREESFGHLLRITEQMGRIGTAIEVMGNKLETLTEKVDEIPEIPEPVELPERPCAPLAGHLQSHAEAAKDRKEALRDWRRPTVAGLVAAGFTAAGFLLNQLWGVLAAFLRGG